MFWTLRYHLLRAHKWTGSSGADDIRVKGLAGRVDTGVGIREGRRDVSHVV